MKRLTYILLALLFALCSALPSVSFATTMEELDEITTPNIILYEANTGTVLYERSSRQRVYPASTTKIMTCLLALEMSGDINSTYTCGFESTNGFGQQSSLLGLQYGYVMTIKDMLYGLMLVSGNDCGACLAVATCGSIDAFVEKMNEKAAEIGMKDTHYVNPHGLHNEEHYTTAYDMALLMTYALQNEVFRDMLKTTEYTVNEVNGKFSRTINTSNKLLYTKPDDTENNEYPYTIGGKTGETNVAGFTLVEAAEKNGVTLVAVLMGDNNQMTSKYYRFRNAVKLFNWGFDNYVCYDADDFNTTGTPDTSKISLNNKFNIQTVDYLETDPNRGIIEAEADISGIHIAGVKDRIGPIEESSFTWSEPVLDTSAVTAPVKVGDKLGTVTLYFNGSAILDCDLTANQAVDAKRSVVIGETEDPNAVNIVTGTTSPVKEQVCNLTVSKNGGDDKYTVWVFYDNTLCTMEGGTTCYYLYYDGEVFRSATAPAEKTITLYRIVEDENGGIYYIPNAEAEAGGKYIVACGSRALTPNKSGRSLEAKTLEFDEAGNLVSSNVTDILWTFTPKGNGYQLTCGGRYLHRSAGDGLLFWIGIAVLALIVAVLVWVLVVRKNNKYRPRRRGGYRIYRA